MMECWNTGILGYWNDGMVEYCFFVRCFVFGVFEVFGGLEVKISLNVKIFPCCCF